MLCDNRFYQLVVTDKIGIIGRAFSLFFHVFWLMFEYKRPHFGDFIHKTIISKWNGKVYIFFAYLNNLFSVNPPQKGVLGNTELPGRLSGGDFFVFPLLF